MKRTGIILLLVMLPFCLFAEAEETQDAVDALLETIDLSEWDAWFLKNGSETDILPSKLLRQLADMQEPFEFSFTHRDLKSLLKPSLLSVLARAALLVGLAAFGAAIRGVTDASSIGETAGTVFRIGVSVTVLVVSLKEVRTAISAIGATERTAELLLPVIVGYLTVAGAHQGALLLPASYAMLSDVVIRLIETCVVPTAIIGGVLLVLDANGFGRLSTLGKLLQRAAKWILGTACSLYMIITAFRSVAARNADHLLLKTTKLAAGSIPSIGALLSESVDAAYQCMQYVRNALGLTGCAVLLSVALKPAISVFLTRSSLRASALLSEPLAGKPYAELLRGMGDTLHILMLSELAALSMALMMLIPALGTGV